jgi:hypothetical protein
MLAYTANSYWYCALGGGEDAAVTILGPFLDVPSAAFQMYERKAGHHGYLHTLTTVWQVRGPGGLTRLCIEQEFISKVASPPALEEYQTGRETLAAFPPGIALGGGQIDVAVRPALGAPPDQRVMLSGDYGALGGNALITLPVAPPAAAEAPETPLAAPLAPGTPPEPEALGDPSPPEPEPLLAEPEPLRRPGRLAVRHAPS